MGVTDTDASHWLAELPDDPDSPRPPLPSEADVVVVGGGVIGVAATYWLARAGAKPLLLEARGLASGASGRNGGLVLAGRSPLEDPATLRAVLAEERIDAGYEEPGHLALAASDSVWDGFRAEAARRPPDAGALHALDRRDCEDLLRMRIARSFRGGRWLPSGGLIDPVRLVAGLAAAAARRGASIVTGAPVTRIAASGGEVHVRTRRGTVRARRVLVACGFRTAELVGARGLLTAVRGQMLSTAPLPRLFGPGMALDLGTVYWRHARCGEIVLGGYRALDAAAEATPRAAVNPRIQAALERFLPDSFPDLPPLRIVRRWAGIMDEAADGRPIAGPWRADGVWVAAGFGGHGLPPALGVGRALARALVRGGPAHELERLSPARLGGHPAAAAA
jgi:gamma-glutamylputrescine oxidase